MTILGLPFHLYGLIVASGAAVALLLIEVLVKRLKIDADVYWELVGVALIGGMIGARGYHVATDWYLYTENWMAALYIWTGGLSIIGAVLGGGVAVWLYARWQGISVSTTRKLLDLSAFGLPVGQAIGRWGNYVNQELYGLPTTLPWAIKIDALHRLPGFQADAFYHPLFAYEQLMLLLFAGLLWWRYGWESNIQQLEERAGTGVFFVGYIAFYSLVRFFLDFLRIDKAVIVGVGIGINQVVMLAVFCGAAWWLYQYWQKEQA